MKKLIIANWKMHLTAKAAVRLASQIGWSFETKSIDLALCPSFTALSEIAALGKDNFELGAQDVFWAKSGAYTGEVSPLDLKELGCRFVIIGHSERRQFLGESDEMISLKAQTALNVGLVPVVCVGESAEERAGNRQEEVVRRQVQADLGKAGDLSDTPVVIAYEPVWAIGAGRTPQPAEIQEMHRLIFSLVKELPGGESAKLKVIYGGSVDADNILDLLALKKVDGALVGGASAEWPKFKSLLAILNSKF